ncbi:putative RING finger protein C2F3.16 [Morella rubra]|uniref:Putative RING finger protein C2F3.16 n=1 Tax=Morella rubra TaxID=262757 RepID=A0A6A1VUT3_9ROSI|nr:putative RING finger protein C2F3.16 [Morella rubra]
MAADDDDTVFPVAETVAAVPLAEAPILFFVCFHRAIRSELAALRRLAVGAPPESGSHGRKLVLELRWRFEFLKLVCKFHCAAEDEVLFLVLDVHVKNVACTYSLEHESFDDLFDSVFPCLDVLLEEKNNVSIMFQELICCISTIQNSICQHMLKEEQQVFPLLMQQLSFQEQSSLVWQFICSVPVMLMEQFLPWMMSFLSPGEQADVIHSVQKIIPLEKSFQEVVCSWLGCRNQVSSGAYTTAGKGMQNPGGSADMRRILELYSTKRPFRENWNWIKACCIQTDVGHKPIDCLSLWHGVIMKDLKGILEELYEIRSSSCFSNLDSVVIQLKFLVDVLSFYSNALRKLFYPLLNQLANDFLSPSNERFPSGSHVESLLCLLQHNAQNGIPLGKFLKNICRELEAFVLEVSKQFAFQEMEVFPTIRKKCSHEIQQQLLYMSLNTMPLGLLKCAITWFSVHLSEDESRSILHSIKQGYSFVNKSFASLLHSWFQTGYSGKISVEKLREDLLKVFKSRCSFQSEQIKEASGSSSLHLDMQLPEGSNCRSTEPVFADKGKNCLSSSSNPHNAKKYETSYSNGINLHVFFPRTIKPVHLFPKFPGDNSSSSSVVVNEPKPVDIIFFFHKALRKDLEYLVLKSAELAEDLGLLMDFCRRFNLIRVLYQIHSDAEDKVAFPALEAKGKLQNISHSYTIDHKLEVQHFSRISLILDKIYELQVSVSCAESTVQDERMVKHHKLCGKLHNMCNSMHKLLSNHIYREEVEIWPLFRESFSIEEQEKIIGRMFGRTGAEVLQDMIPWLMESLTAEEGHAMMSSWCKVTKNTMFDEWLREWWEGYDTAKLAEESSISPSRTTDPLDVISRYLSQEVLNEQKEDIFLEKCSKRDQVVANIEPFRNQNVGDKEKVLNGDQHSNDCSECAKLLTNCDKKRCSEAVAIKDQIDKSSQIFQLCESSWPGERLLTMSQEDLEAAIRRVSRDSSLDLQKKSYIIQNLLMGRWIVRQQISHSVSSNKEGIPGRYPSYQDHLKLTFGCKHYKRNCKLFASCCNQLYACIRCHDEVADHTLDRKSITKMMCMKCLKIQPIGPTCSTVSCDNFSMARYYCKICKLFDDGREIYHCPYCNLCRLGKGLGIDYFHCMNCNACMSRSLSAHICREKCLEDNCPICHEYIFTSSSPVKALPCGHLMHSTCFQDYTCIHYTCPICSKSLGDMQVYFRMLDAMLAEEKIPDEYAGRTQVILCNDCEKRGAAPFHWLYHKCSFCGSYNTRPL